MLGQKQSYRDGLSKGSGSFRWASSRRDSRLRQHADPATYGTTRPRCASPRVRCSTEQRHQEFPALLPVVALGRFQEL
jgi:hypothetical protein